MLHRNTIDDIRSEFVNLFLNEDYIKSGSTHTIEIVNATFEVAPDETTIFGTLNEYANRELAWYLSESLSVKDIPGECPKIWEYCATKNDEKLINSNYGYLEFNHENFNQYKNAVNELIKDPTSRRACHIYTRPSIWNEYNKDGMSDFICTFATQQFIRNNTLIYCISMRSNDAVTGFKNDLFWARYIAKRMILDLHTAGMKELADEPIIYWNANSLHVYERSFKLIIDYINKSNNKEWMSKLYNNKWYLSLMI